MRLLDRDELDKKKKKKLETDGFYLKKNPT